MACDFADLVQNLFMHFARCVSAEYPSAKQVLSANSVCVAALRRKKCPEGLPESCGACPDPDSGPVLNVLTERTRGGDTVAFIRGRRSDLGVGAEGRLLLCTLRPNLIPVAKVQSTVLIRDLSGLSKPDRSVPAGSAVRVSFPRRGNCSHLYNDPAQMV